MTGVRIWRVDHFDSDGEKIARGSTYPYLTNALTGALTRLERHPEIAAVVMSRRGLTFALLTRGDHERTVDVSGYAEDGQDLSPQRQRALMHVQSTMRSGVRIPTGPVWAAERRRPTVER